MMDHADIELGDVLNEQYSDTISPPKFMIISLIIGYFGQHMLRKSNAVPDLPDWLHDQQSFMAFSLLIFSMTPLVMAIRLARQLDQPLDRSTLRPPFYSQCYLGGAVLLIAASINFLAGVELFDATMTAASKVCLVGWYFIQQTLWFRAKLNCGYMRSIWLVASSGAIAGVCVLVMVTVAAVL